MDDQRWKSWFPGVCRRQISTFIPTHIVKMWENSSGETVFYCYMLKNPWESGNTFQRNHNETCSSCKIFLFISVIALDGRFMIQSSFFVFVVSILRLEDFHYTIYLSKQPWRSKKIGRTKGAIFTFPAPLQTFAVVWEDACHHYLFILGGKLFSPHVFSELTKAWQLPTVPFNRFCACSRGRAGRPRHPAPTSPTAPEATLSSKRWEGGVSIQPPGHKRRQKVTNKWSSGSSGHPALPLWIPLQLLSMCSKLDVS